VGGAAAWLRSGFRSRAPARRCYDEIRFISMSILFVCPHCYDTVARPAVARALEEQRPDARRAV
jgi:hypothetical protein